MITEKVLVDVKAEFRLIVAVIIIEWLPISEVRLVLTFNVIAVESKVKRELGRVLPSLNVAA
jgi:hypothetical protein